jgi:hypothetical protein
MNYEYLPKAVVDVFIKEEAEIKTIGKYTITILGKYDSEVRHDDNIVASRENGIYRKITLVKNSSDYCYKYMESDCTIYINKSISVEMFCMIPDTSKMTFIITDITYMELLVNKYSILKGVTIDIQPETAQTVNLDYLSCKILKVKNVEMTGKSDCISLISFNDHNYEVNEEQFPNLLYTNLIAKHAILYFDVEFILNKEHPKYSPVIVKNTCCDMPEFIEYYGKLTSRMTNRVNAKSARKL